MDVGPICRYASGGRETVNGIHIAKVLTFGNPTEMFYFASGNTRRGPGLWHGIGIGESAITRHPSES